MLTGFFMHQIFFRSFVRTFKYNSISSRYSLIDSALFLSPLTSSIIYFIDPYISKPCLFLIIYIWFKRFSVLIYLFSSSLIALISFFSLKRFITSLIMVSLITLPSIFVLEDLSFYVLIKRPEVSIREYKILVEI